MKKTGLIILSSFATSLLFSVFIQPLLVRQDAFAAISTDDQAKAELTSNCASQEKIDITRGDVQSILWFTGTTLNSNGTVTTTMHLSAKVCDWSKAGGNGNRTNLTYYYWGDGTGSNKPVEYREKPCMIGSSTYYRPNPYPDYSLPCSWAKVSDPNAPAMDYTNTNKLTYGSVNRGGFSTKEKTFNTGIKPGDDGCISLSFFKHYYSDQQVQWTDGEAKTAKICKNKWSLSVSTKVKTSASHTSYNTGTISAKSGETITWEHILKNNGPKTVDDATLFYRSSDDWSTSKGLAGCSSSSTATKTSGSASLWHCKSPVISSGLTKGKSLNFTTTHKITDEEEGTTLCRSTRANMTAWNNANSIESNKACVKVDKSPLPEAKSGTIDPGIRAEQDGSTLYSGGTARFNLSISRDTGNITAPIGPYVVAASAYMVPAKHADDYNKLIAQYQGVAKAIYPGFNFGGDAVAFAGTPAINNYGDALQYPNAMSWLEATNITESCGATGTNISDCHDGAVWGRGTDLAWSSNDYRVNIPDNAKAGDLICTALTVTNWKFGDMAKNHGTNSVDTPVRIAYGCLTITKSPSLIIQGADSWSNDGFYGGIQVGNIGSWSQYGLFANNNDISAFGTAGWTNIDGKGNNYLKMAYANNVSNNLGRFGGNSHDINALISRYNTANETTDIYINSDIIMDNSNGINNLNLQKIVTTGDIIIGSNVERIDAILISGGTVYTCGKDSTNNMFGVNGVCNRKLTINGAIIANNTKFQRVAAPDNLDDANNQDANSPNKLPAEVIHYNPSVYLSGYRPPENGKIKIIPILQREVAPRY